MRRILICIILFTLLHLNLNAKTDAPSFCLYGDLGTGVSNLHTFQLGLNHINRHNNYMGVTFVYQQRDATDVPSDYNPGLILLGASRPQQRLTYLNLTAGKVIPFVGKPCRIVLKAGLSLGVTHLPAKYSYHTPGYFGDNYNVDYENLPMGGLTFNPCFELPVSRGFGFSTGLWGSLNSAANSAGVNFSLLFGKVRNNRRLQHN